MCHVPKNPSRTRFSTPQLGHSTTRSDVALGLTEVTVWYWIVVSRRAMGLTSNTFPQPMHVTFVAMIIPPLCLRTRGRRAPPAARPTRGRGQFRHVDLRVRGL